MSSQHTATPFISLPSLPADHVDWISYVSKHPETTIHDLITPYKEYDSKLREIFAQQPEHPAILKPNIIPIFSGHEHELNIRARNPSTESESERECYIMPLKDADRKANGSPAVVQSLKEFRTNFQLFSESSLVDMDWSNVVVAGSAVVTSLLPVPDKYNTSKRALREYYHQKLAPASDVDLFIYGLTEEQAIDKIKQIEQRIKDSILTETTTVRTKNAITIVSQYPTRHVQIVLRIYRSISEILTGFDVDCSCAAYDGTQVYASPRALAAYITQINTIDLTRRSPSYENRLSKYSRRGFEVYWPLLDRSRIDPTLFERSFGRTLGLARLLVLEKLPKNTDREAYIDQRRQERGRPAINRWASRKLKGNMKEEHDDEVAEWIETDEVSDYHTFTIPYGPKYHARKIERLLYAKDLLLNAEWNRPKERETTLHRHPAFFGSVEACLEDCCGYCPEPITSEDKKVFEEENKVYVSGKLSFIKDNPGRQAIGSFNPLTNDDWTEMAYVSNTTRLCQAIVDCNLEHVQDCLRQEGADPNRRDYTGRAPLHLAVSSSTPEIVQCLIDAGARIVARLFDGKTALHLAAMRGEVAMVKALLIKSEANEEKEAEKEDLKRKVQKAAEKENQDVVGVSPFPLPENEYGPTEEKTSMCGSKTENSEEDDIDMMSDNSSENGGATTENSIIKIDSEKSKEQENLLDNADEDEPDVYDVNVLAWDTPVSALHLAIANGHTEVVKVLIQDFGADVLLPVKLVNDNKSPRGAILPVVLGLQLPTNKSKEMTELLISLGASPSQGDISNLTALQYFVAHGSDMLKTMIAANQPAAQRAVSHLSMSGYKYTPISQSVLNIAIEHGDAAAVDALLELGSKAEIDFATYMTSFKTKWEPTGDPEYNKKQFRNNFVQPVLTAVKCETPSIVLSLLDAGADINTLSTGAWRASAREHVYGRQNIESLLDSVRNKIKQLRKYLETGQTNTFGDGFYNSYKPTCAFPPITLKDDAEYLQNQVPGSYDYWCTMQQIQQERENYKEALKSHEKWLESQDEARGMQAKKAAVQALLMQFEDLELQLLERGAKTFAELHPDIKLPDAETQYGGQPFYNNEPAPPGPWSPHLSFQIPDLTDERRVAYIKLFQACWDADLSTIKELTLAVWGDNQSPLKIAVQDAQNLSPFSIAILRKHFDIAKIILEIASAQYAPEEKTGQAKHSLQVGGEDDNSCGSGDEDEVQIYAEIIDDRFTLDNIGEVQNQVKSKVTPLELISWYCPAHIFLENEGAPSPSSNASSSTFGRVFGSDWYENYMSRRRFTPRQILKDAANNRSYPEYSRVLTIEEAPEVWKPTNLFQFAICVDNIELLHFMITLGEEYTIQADNADEISPRFFTFAEVDFLYALGLGRTQHLEEIIKRSGTGIPLDDLVRKSGVKIVQKPKYYQGLSVHGKKRADWANAGRETQRKPVGAEHPPLLQAARLGSLESVQWFLSDAPLRCYSEFAENHRGDIRIQNLVKSEGGLEATIGKWLDLRSHLLIHCVVLGKSNEDSFNLLRYLCKAHPGALHHRSGNGMTPLQLAFSLHRVEMAKILVEAGADQTCRNNDGDNIIHSMLIPGSHNDFEKHLENLRELFDLIDSRLLASLFLERTTNSPGAATPIARWLTTSVKTNDHWQHTKSDEKWEKYLQIILEFSKGEELGVVDGAGDTPLHTAIRYSACRVLRAMLECRPELLFRENTTGRTPYEMAKDAYLAKEVFNNPPIVGTSGKYHYNHYNHNQDVSTRLLAPGQQDTSPIVDRQATTFVDEAVDPRTPVRITWEICDQFAAKAEDTKRKLVSLVEANEVAKRLAVRKCSSLDAVSKEENDEAKDDQEDIQGDEVALWAGLGLIQN